MHEVIIHLQRKVQEVNHTIQDTGQQVHFSSGTVIVVIQVSCAQLMQSAAELHHARHVQKNILATVEALGLCVPGEYAQVIGSVYRKPVCL